MVNAFQVALVGHLDPAVPEGYILDSGLYELKKSLFQRPTCKQELINIIFLLFHSHNPLNYSFPNPKHTVIPCFVSIISYRLCFWRQTLCLSF